MYSFWCYKLIRHILSRNITHQSTVKYAHQVTFLNPTSNLTAKPTVEPTVAPTTTQPTAHTTNWCPNWCTDRRTYNYFQDLTNSPTDPTTAGSPYTPINTLKNATIYTATHNAPTPDPMTGTIGVQTMNPMVGPDMNPKNASPFESFFSSFAPTISPNKSTSLSTSPITVPLAAPIDYHTTVSRNVPIHGPTRAWVSTPNSKGSPTNENWQEQKRAVGAFQTIFVKWVSLGNLLVLQKVSLHVLAVSSEHLFTQILHVDCNISVNSSKREYDV